MPEMFPIMNPFLRKLIKPCTKPALLVCTEAFWGALRQHLLKPDGKERVAFSLLGRSETSDRVAYYGFRLLPISDERCVEQHPYLVEPDPVAVVDCFDAYHQSFAVAFMHAHSHPFCNVAAFSGTDDAYLPGTVQSLQEYLEATESHRPCRFLRMVTGQNEGGFRIEVYDSQSCFVEDVTEVRVVGSKGVRRIEREGSLERVRASVPRLIERDKIRLDRNVRWLGEAGQATIADVHVGLAGVGGVGTELVKICRGLGIKKYTLIDMDKVEPANLNRLMWSISDVGEFKVELARRFILSAIPDAEVRALTMPVESTEAQEALSQVDVIMASVDNDSARLNLQVLAARTLKPLLDLGSGIRLERGSTKVKSMGAQVAFYTPGGPCLACLGLDLNSVEDPEQREARRRIGYIEGTEETPASVVTINSVIAGIAGDMLVKYVTGFAEAPTLVTYDALDHATLALRLGGASGCPICGKTGIQGMGLEQETPMLPSRGMSALFASQPVTSGPRGDGAAIAPIAESNQNQNAPR